MKKALSKLKNKKTQVTSLAILGILFITAGISYAFFTYSRDGLKENVIESGSIKFHYQEDSQGISITDGMPVDDNTGKSSNKYFDFSVTSTTSSKIKIPYYVTVKRKGNDSSLDNAVKLYLTEVNNNIETELTLDNNKQITKYSELANYVNNDLNITVAKNEKSLYRGTVPVNSNNYEKHYRLRMWLTDGIEFTQTVTGSCSDPTYTTEDACVEAHKDWTDVATTDQKEFTVKVNVYGFANTASDNVNINSLSVGNTELTPVSTDTYETSVESGTTETTINVETENENATAQVTKTQSDYTTPVAMSNNVQRLSATKSLPVTLTEGDNYFKVVITSEDSTKNKELHLKITVAPLYPVLRQAILNNNTLITAAPTLNNSSNNTSDASGLYKMSVTNGFGGANGDTYYFRGNVTNNYVVFGTWKSDMYFGNLRENDATDNYAISYQSLEECQNAPDYNYNCRKVRSAGSPMIWRIVRINEDGTVRLILDNVIDKTWRAIGMTGSWNEQKAEQVYYTNWPLKSELEDWYTDNITGIDGTKVASGNYYCQASKVIYIVFDAFGQVYGTKYDSYTPDLRCEADGNGFGLLSGNIGLLTYDETVLAGGYPDKPNTQYYLHDDKFYQHPQPIMDPAAGDSQSHAGYYWYVSGTEGIIGNHGSMEATLVIKPVINLKADTLVSGSGTESDPYVVQ